MEFSEYQSKADETNLHAGSDPISFFLHGLSGELGVLTAAYKKRLRDNSSHELFVRRAHEELGDLLWYASALAGALGLDLDEIARTNLNKVAARWSAQQAARPPLDAAAPEGERFPRRLRVEFIDDGNKLRVFGADGEQIGASLDDNANAEDGYRFHDVFHLANAAVLGWSPVIRALLKRKRKYDPAVDNAEDGARAIFTEEGIVAVTFRHAERHNLFAGVHHVESDLLEFIRVGVAGLEVSACTPAEWESAILQAFEVFRTLRSHRGGTVLCDLDTATITVEPTVQSSGA